MVLPSDHPITRSRDQRILYVAYPLLTVSEESAGGAEQMLWTLEHEMAVRGARTVVAASTGSRVSGELFITGEPCSEPDDFDRRNREHQEKIVEFVSACEHQGLAFDLVHDKSGSFWQRTGEMNVPVLATLHLPRHFYSAGLFKNVPENVIFNCVSASQARSFADLNPTVVPNGIMLDRFLSLSRAERAIPTTAKTAGFRREGLLWLGRICEEKGPHLALDIAARANQPITLAGQVYPFSYHQQYFEREVAPRLERMQNAIFIPAPSLEQKCQLLRECRALLITSLVDETGSLVAMEAAASGVPVIAFRRGALPEIVQDGVTGFVVDGVEEAVEALKRVEEIHSADCMKHARANFSSAKMTDDYARLYKQITEREVSNLLPQQSPSNDPIIGDPITSPIPLSSPVPENVDEFVGRRT